MLFQRSRWLLAAVAALAIAGAVYLFTRDAWPSIMMLLFGLTALLVPPAEKWTRRELVLGVLAGLFLSLAAYLLVQLRICEMQLRVAIRP